MKRFIRADFRWVQAMATLARLGLAAAFMLALRDMRRELGRPNPSHASMKDIIAPAARLDR